MKVIFQQDVRGQGKKGEMKEVSEGYARNYLLPRKLAVEANKDNMNALALKEKAKKAQEQREREAAEANARRLKDVVVTIRARSGANGKLFGSVTSQEICDALVYATKRESTELQILQAGQVRRETFAVKAAQARNLGGAFITSADSAEDLLICGGIPELLQQHIRSFPDQTAVRGKEQGSGSFLY